jgi:hypothetical protein
MSTKTFSIKAAAAELGLSEVYVRRAIQTGKLATTKTQVGDTEVWRHEISEETLNAWRKDAGARSTRTDGRNKYTVYATSEELAAFKAWLVESKSKMVLERANSPEKTKANYQKNKMKRAQKKAQAKAQKQADIKAIADTVAK